MGFLDDVWDSTGGAVIDYLGGGTPPTTNAPPVNYGNYQLGGVDSRAEQIVDNTHNNAMRMRQREAPTIDQQQIQYGFANEAINAGRTQLDAANLNAGQSLNDSNQFRAGQTGLISDLQAAAAGTGGPSAAELAMRSQSQQAGRQALALAQMGSGPGANAGVINAQNQNIAAQGALTRDLGVQRANEQVAAREQLAGVLGQARGQDFAAADSWAGIGQGAANIYGQYAGQLAGQAENQAQIDFNVGTANQNAVIQQNAMNDAASQYYYGSALDMERWQAEMNARANETDINRGLGVGSNATAGWNAQQNASSQRVGAVMNAGGALMMLSDIRAKTGIQPSGAAGQPMRATGDAAERISNVLQQSGATRPQSSMGSRMNIGGAGWERFSSLPPEIQQSFSVFSDLRAKDDIRPSGATGEALDAQDSGAGYGSYQQSGEFLDAQDSVERMQLQRSEDAVRRGREEEQRQADIQSEQRQQQIRSAALNRIANAGSGMTGGPTIQPQQYRVGGITPQYRFSDVRAKTDVEPATASVDDTFRRIGSYTYEYRDPERHGEGRFAGPMAQELEQTPIGADMVHETPRGKAVDAGRLAMANAAETANLRREIDDLYAAINGAGSSDERLNVAQGRYERLRQENDRDAQLLSALGRVEAPTYDGPSTTYAQTAPVNYGAYGWGR